MAIPSKRRPSNTEAIQKGPEQHQYLGICIAKCVPFSRKYFETHEKVANCHEIPNKTQVNLPPYPGTELVLRDTSTCLLILHRVQFSLGIGETNIAIATVWLEPSRLDNVQLQVVCWGKLPRHGSIIMLAGHTGFDSGFVRRMFHF